MTAGELDADRRSDRVRQFARGLVCAAITAAPLQTASADQFASIDVSRAAQAATAFSQGDYGRAAAIRETIADPLARTLVTWYAASSGSSILPFAEQTAFITAHTGWPLVERMKYNADAAIAQDTPLWLLRNWYTRNHPVSATGRRALIARLRGAGDEAATADAVRRIWRGSYISRTEQKAYLAQFAELLRPDDHVARLSHLLLHGQGRAAEELLAEIRLEPDRRAVFDARLRMRSRRTRDDHAGISALLARAPEDHRTEEGSLLDQIRWHRRENRVAEAVALLDVAPEGPARPALWFSERNRLVRWAIKEGRIDLAYRIAARHQLGRAGEAVDAEWLAGFVAFRFGDDASAASAHFGNGLERATNARDRARFAYWLGRAANATGEDGAARAYYIDAARFPGTFYGQLAASRLDSATLIFDGDTPVDTEAARFSSHEFVLGMSLMRSLGRTMHARAMAIYALRHAGGTDAQVGALVENAMAWYPAERRRQMEVRLVRYANYRGRNIARIGFPTLALPEENPIEPALVYALIRQESEFNVGAQSWAGARGLMQLMPFTARREARTIGVGYSRRKLTQDADYNLRLGTTHLVRLMNEYGGSYPLVLAAYNAGAHRVDRWLRDYGDPRLPGSRIEWVDWIELIPFDETRNYVKRVLENYTVYRVSGGAETTPALLTDYWNIAWPINCGQTVVAETSESDTETVATAHNSPLEARLAALCADTR